MIAEANKLFTEALAFSKANPIIASAAGLWGLSVLTFVLRDIPSRIWGFISRQSLTTLELNSQDEIFFQVLNWVSANKMHRFVRNFNLHNGTGNRGYDPDEKLSQPKALSIGYGTTFFLHEKRLFFISRYKESNNQSAKVKETMIIRVLGRSQKAFQSLFETVRKADDEDQQYTKIYSYSNEYWSSDVRQFKRDPSTVVIDEDVERKLYSSIDAFLTNKEWYVKNGVPYRLGILLQGPPGTGKTSLVKAICAKYNRDLYLLNLGALNDRSLIESLSAVPENSVVAIEDIDAQGITVKRKQDDEEASSLFKSPISISGILNALDGAASSEDRIVIATTNHPEKLDPAIVRPGRIDLVLTIGNMSTQTFNRYMSRMYPDFKMPEGFVLKDGVSPALVQQLVFENKGAYQAVLEALK